MIVSPPALTEREFQAQVMALAKTLGWRVYHTYDSRRSDPGFPDLVLAHEELGFICAELKTDKGRVSAAQREWGELIAATGTEYHLWRPDDWDAIGDRLQGAI